MEEKYVLNIPPNNNEILLTKFNYKDWDFFYILTIYQKFFMEGIDYF